MAALRFVAVFSTHLPALLNLARALTPRVEVNPPDALILEVSARAEAETIRRLRDFSPQPAIGCAGTRTTALAAARMAPGTFVSAGKEAEFMAPLPASLLTLFHEDEALPDLLLTLSRWGILTLGQLASLPSRDLAARLGQESVLLQRLARGEDLEPLQAELPETRFEAGVDLEYTLASLEPLSFILSGLLEPLCKELQSEGLAAESVDVELKLEGGKISRRRLQLAFPLSHTKTILALLRLELESHTEEAAVNGVTVRLNPTPPRIFQYSLFEPLTPRPEKLARTLGRLEALVGKANVGCPALIDTHRPDAFRLAPFDPSPRPGKAAEARPASARLALRRFRPPLPARIRSEQTAGWAGPWRTSGDWWADRPWDHEEWDVEFLNGTVYRVFFDQRKKGWFLEGVYD